MSKERNDLFVVIIFSIIWIVRPISYDEMRSRHPIYPQENVVIVNSSSISNQNDELDFLESTTRDIILAKDTSVLQTAFHHLFHNGKEVEQQTE
jgi:hypothetical protein